MRILCCGLALLAALSGCVSKSKARAQAQEAFLAGQRQAMALQQTREPSVSFVGPVNNRLIPWTENLTLAHALVAAEYVGRADPSALVIVRDSRPISVNPKDLLSGKDVPLQQGDIIHVIP